MDGVTGATAFLGLHRQRLSVLELLGTVTSARGLLCDNADERGVRFSSPTEPDVDDWFGSKMWNGDGPKASPAVWDHAGFIGGFRSKVETVLKNYLCVGNFCGPRRGL